MSRPMRIPQRLESSNLEWEIKGFVKVGSTPTPGSNGTTQSILDHAFHLKKEGYRKSTIISRLKALKGLSRKADLLNPEAVKVAISMLPVTEGRKENLVHA